MGCGAAIEEEGGRREEERGEKGKMCVMCEKECT
jgi:hypothetical protein